MSEIKRSLTSEILYKYLHGQLPKKERIHIRELVHKNELYISILDGIEAMEVIYGKEKTLRFLKEDGFDIKIQTAT